jgi:hypothetical protein
MPNAEADVRNTPNDAAAGRSVHNRQTTGCLERECVYLLSYVMNLLISVMSRMSACIMRVLVLKNADALE